MSAEAVRRGAAALAVAGLAVVSAPAATAFAAPYTPPAPVAHVSVFEAVGDPGPLPEVTEPEPVTYRLDLEQFAALVIGIGLALALLGAIFVLTLVR